MVEPDVAAKLGNVVLADVEAGAAASASPLGLALPTVTVTWKAVKGATGFVLFRDGKKIATAGPKARSAKFGVDAKKHTFQVAAVGAAAAQTITVQIS